MSCQDPQNQMGYSDMQGQSSLTHVLSHNFMTGGAAQTGAAGAAMQAAGPYGTTSGAISQPTTPGTPLNQYMPITPTTEPPPLNVNNLQYLNAALRTQIGRKVTIDFLIGTNTLVDKTGTLLAVGANYLIINEIETDDLLFCDFFTIKFVKVYG